MKNREYIEMSLTYPNGITEIRKVKLDNFRKALRLCQKSKNLV